MGNVPRLNKQLLYWTKNAESVQEAKEMEVEAIIRVQLTGIATGQVLLAVRHSRDCGLCPRSAGFLKSLCVWCFELEFYRCLPEKYPSIC